VATDELRVDRQEGFNSSDSNLEKALEALNETLHRRGQAHDFSDEALAVVLKLQLDYIEEIGTEAIRLANRNQADVVSAADLERADRTVRAATSGRAWLEALGGILAGAGVGTFLQLAVADNPSTLGLSISATIGAVGLMVVAAALVSQRRILG
jgi:hypothetical protein